MCGRYVIDAEGDMDLEELYLSIQERHGEMTLKRGEIFPTDTVPLLREEDGRLSAFPGIWGYPVGKEGRLLINARAETVMDRPAFSGSFFRRRCVVPGSGYYEWSQDHQKFRLNLPKKRHLFFAGIYEQCEEGAYFAILTTKPKGEMASFHPRMPLLLPTGALLPWVQDEEFAIRYLRAEMPELVMQIV